MRYNITWLAVGREGGTSSFPEWHAQTFPKILFGQFESTSGV